MDTEKIANLASAAHDARQLFQNLGMLNVKHGPEENRQQTINYELAKAAMFEANSNLRKAQGL
jgi:hypothetical protein